MGSPGISYCLSDWSIIKIKMINYKNKDGKNHASCIVKWNKMGDKQQSQSVIYCLKCWAHTNKVLAFCHCLYFCRANGSNQAMGCQYSFSNNLLKFLQWLEFKVQLWGKRGYGLIVLGGMMSKKYLGGAVSLKVSLPCSAFRQDFEYAKTRHHS